MSKEYEMKIAKLCKGGTYYSPCAKMWNYPSNRLIETLKKIKVKKIVYKNGDFLTL